MIKSIAAGVVLVMTCGCTVDVSQPGAEPEEGRVAEADIRVAPWPYTDLLSTPWSGGNWREALPALPNSAVGVFRGVDGASYAAVYNDNPFPLGIGGAFWYKCSATQTNQNDLLLSTGYRPLVNPTIVAANAMKTFKIPLCSPVTTAANVEYLPIAPSGAVPFHDAYAQVGDGFNFFPNDQMRLSSSVAVARSGGMSVTPNGYHNLFVRYAHPHPGHPSAVIKIGIQNSATGATVQAFNDVSFSVTPVTDDFDQWQQVAVTFLAPSSVQNVYVRLELHNQEVVYLDAAWVY